MSLSRVTVSSRPAAVQNGDGNRNCRLFRRFRDGGVIANLALTRAGLEDLLAHWARPRDAEIRQTGMIDRAILGNHWVSTGIGIGVGARLGDSFDNEEGSAVQKGNHRSHR